jgi:membrane protease YdiL (CAAX protease family)
MTTLTRERTAAVAGFAIVLAVGAALAVRPTLLATHALSMDARVGLLGGFYAAVLVASALATPERERGVLPSALVLAIGVCAVAVAWASAGPRAPLASTAAGVALSVLAAIAEEACFRGLAYARLRTLGVPAAIGLGALLFAAVHIPSYGLAAFPVDLGAGVLFGWQRWASGTWTVPATTHVAANLLAVIR